MRPCKHTKWLSVWKDGANIGLEVSNRPRRMLEGVASVDSASGGVLFMVGNAGKRHALKSLEQPYRQRSTLQGEEVHLRTFDLRYPSGGPVVVVDAEVPSDFRPLPPRGSERCHKVRSHRLETGPGLDGIGRSLRDIQRRVILPLADVVCIFVDDLGGMRRSLQLVEAWLVPDGSRRATLPHLLLIIGQNRERGASSMLQDFIISKRAEIEERFKNVSTVHTGCRARRRRRGRHHRTAGPVLDAILRAIDARRSARRRSRHNFAVRHVAELLSMAISQYLASPRETLDFIHLCRDGWGVAADLPEHIFNFLCQFQKPGSVRRIAIPTVASSLILDHYAPGMHLYDAAEVFEALYAAKCFAAADRLSRETKTKIPPREIVRLIRNEMITQFSQLLAIGTAAQWHRKHLMRFRALHDICMVDTCLSCLRRRPQHRMPCGHLFCQVCLKIFHRKESEQSWTLRPDSCHVCGLGCAGLAVRLIPDTARARVLSIDGGGVRGIAPLNFLKAIQEEIGIEDHNIGDDFDVVLGTSSGGLSAICLGLFGWSIDRCLAAFRDFAARAFECEQPKALRCLAKCPFLTPLARLLTILIAVLADSKYSGAQLEQLLQQICGAGRTMLDRCPREESCPFVGVTLTATYDGRAVICTSYNCIGTRSSSSGILPSYDGRRFISLWEIARCATAAPYYFPPKRLGQLGNFQDGGLAFNNPASLAVQEAIAVNPDAGEPDLVLSLGTGLKAPSNPQGKTHWLHNTFPFRISQALWNLGSSTFAWAQLLENRGSSRTDYHRIDIHTQGKETRLDEVNRMQAFGDMAYKSVKGSKQVRTIASRLRAEFFIFQLDPLSPPTYFNGAYNCVGYVTCRLGGGDEKVQALMRQLVAKSSTFRLRQQSVDCSSHRIDGTFTHKMEFRVASMQESFHVVLSVGNDVDCDISGSPFTLDWLVQRQKIGRCFGVEDHRKRPVPPGIDGRISKRRRL
ncbi:acyl transferase/acyl hydrolase/lysophospholipase [Emericellopsis atlantica]|uniref:Acyl transferase/acyl hydrolase/lysophospholipase n=1 Tax=Emericellopsis atlantica TaxID=2614577 RepID=A0A9P8CJK6_9HYPO|nr:acyl transferase/acyl hydrolase/lysophospholipase [Emericellopsis atlantica]KAG9249569.1 acyl transferase/acyl hydrolase/lysophospholipase [Emericellopsis atlantica]